MSDAQISFPLVAAQPGIWMADKLLKDSNAFAVAHLLTINGNIVADRLLDAINQALSEVDTLHYHFLDIDGVPQQFPGDPAVIPAEYLDFRSKEQPIIEANSLIKQDLSANLRLTQGKSSYRQLLIQVGEKHWLWYQRYHHLVIDGYSFIAITRRICELYQAAIHQRPRPASPFNSFCSVIDEYRDYQLSQQYQRDADYWRKKVAALPPALSLSSQPLISVSPTTYLWREKLVLTSGSLAPLYQLIMPQQLSEADGAVALVATWLALITGRQALSCGFIYMRRLGSAALTATGPVINLLPISINFTPQQNFVELAVDLAKEIKTNRRHQRYNAEQINRDSGRLGDNQPLFGPVINLKLFDYQFSLDNATISTEHLASGPVRDLEIAVIPGTNGTLTLEFLANRQRYSLPTLKAHIARIPLILEQLAKQPLSHLSLLTQAEQQQLTKINDTKKNISDQTLSSLITQQVQRTPTAPALSDMHQLLNYQTMWDQVNTLAHHLIEKGVQAGDIVAVALPRSIYLSLALQAITRLGAIWLPLDTGYPDKRLQFMLEDALPKLLITVPALAERFNTITPITQYHYDQFIEQVVALELSQPTSEQGAYLIYTSGSTGQPKGVLVGQRAIVNRLVWMQEHYQLTPEDIVLQKTPSSFDVSVWEFFLPLICGARLHLAPPETHRDPEWLIQLIAVYRISVLHFVPSMLATFITSLIESTSQTQISSLRLVFCSGEALSTTLARKWERITGVALYNLYGPTEAAVDVSWYPAYGSTLAEVSGQSVPIGWPVWNTQLHILDNCLQPVPMGIPGELWLSGVQLAEGYYQQPDLTASRFITFPGRDGERIYRTGDIVRYLDNGAIEYLGRHDHQVKIRGQRIELGEIDAQLLEFPAIKQAITLAISLSKSTKNHEDDRQLITYVTGITPEQCPIIRQALSDKLPSHLVPLMLIALEEIPLTSNGKLDRAALPAPILKASVNSRPPAAGIECQLAALFCELLTIDTLNADDDFFALGGHSLLAMRLAARIRQQLQKPIEVGQIMVASSVAKLAQLLTVDVTIENQGFSPLLPLRELAGPTLFCFHPASGFAWQFGSLKRYIDKNWSLIGIQSPHPEGPLSWAEELDEVCEQHLQQILQYQPEGPYYFLGYSLGGTLAQGVAARLEARGEEVAYLGLLDTWPPESQHRQTSQAQQAVFPQVIAEIEYERQQFIKSQRQQVSEEISELFEQVTANYNHSIRLLSTARSHITHGPAILFSAQQNFIELDPKQTWLPYIKDLVVFNIACTHAEIITPEKLAIIGPEIDRQLAELIRG